MSGPVTLSTTHPNVTLTGNILGAAYVDKVSDLKYYAAVYGPHQTEFTVTSHAAIQARRAKRA
jgi:hypothetical protein